MTDTTLLQPASLATAAISPTDESELASAADRMGVDTVWLAVPGLADDRWVSGVTNSLAHVAAGSSIVVDLTEVILVSKRPVDDAIEVASRVAGDPARVTVVCPV